MNWCKDNGRENMSDIVVDGHDSWEGLQELSPEEQQLIQNQIEYQIKETAKQVEKRRGTIPGEFKELLDKLFRVEPPVYNWKAHFRRFLGYSDDVTFKKTMRKESNRFKGARGSLLKFKQKVLVCIDTSGSVSNEELYEFFSEIQHMSKAGVSIDVLEFDTIIHKITPYKGKWNGEIHGRGGTEFSSAVAYYNENRRKYNSCVMFTDGYAPTNHLKPLQKMMWVITSDGKKNNKYPGYTIFIPPKNKK